MLKNFMMLLLLAGGMALAACNTVQGVGEDVESVGEATQDAAQ